MGGEFFWKFSSCCSIGASLAGLAVMQRLKRENEAVTAQLNRLAADNRQNLPPLSILVPVRNEAQTITESLTSVLEQDYPDFEVIAIDDNSTDRTPQLLAELAARYPGKLQVIQSSPPPEGWLGKNNALWQGFARVRPGSEWLLFVDADTKLAPGTLRAALNFARFKQLDLLSLVPRMRLKGFWSRITTPEIGKVYLVAAQNPLRLRPKTAASKASAVGPFILVRRWAYEAVDGHRAIRNLIIEDVALAQNFRANGFNTAQVPGLEHVERDWYETLPDLWQGVSKNLFLVADRSWGAVGLVLMMQGCYGLLPLLSLLWRLNRASRYSKTGWILNVLAILLTMLSHSESYRGFGLPRRYALLYPLVVSLGGLLMLHSAFSLGVLRTTSWKGRKLNNTFL